MIQLRFDDMFPGCSYIKAALRARGFDVSTEQSQWLALWWSLNETSNPNFYSYDGIVQKLERFIRKTKS